MISDAVNFSVDSMRLVVRSVYIIAHIGLALLFVATSATINEELFGAERFRIVGSVLFFALIIAGCAYICRPHPIWGLGAIFYAWGMIYLLYTLAGLALQFVSNPGLSVSPLALITGGVLLLSASFRKRAD